MFASKKKRAATDGVPAARIDEIIAVADAICKGDFESRIGNLPAEDGKERRICLKINEMIDRADAYVRESTACLGFVAQNRYFRRIAEHGMLGAYGVASRAINGAADGIEKKMTRFGGMVGTIAGASQDLNLEAQALSGTAQRTSEQATSVSAAAEQAGSNTQTVATAAEELNASIQEINAQVARLSAMVGETMDEVENANAMINGLSKVSQEIGAMVELISDIANKTNLLALNATIEAARAGEAGKGFAVVASEVKNLATQTARATDEIKTQVGQIQSATGAAVRSIADIGRKAAQVTDSSTAIADAIEQQGAATQEIARNVQEASGAVAEVTANIVAVNENVGNVNDVSSKLGAIAKGLAAQSAELSEVLNG